MNTVQLQGIGRVKAKLAGELKIGDVTVWNYGELEKIVGVAKQTMTQIVFDIEYVSRGQVVKSTRRMKRDRLVAFK